MLKFEVSFLICLRKFVFTLDTEKMGQIIFFFEEFFVVDRWAFSFRENFPETEIRNFESESWKTNLSCYSMEVGLGKYDQTGGLDLMCSIPASIVPAANQKALFE